MTGPVAPRHPASTAPTSTNAAGRPAHSWTATASTPSTTVATAAGTVLAAMRELSEPMTALLRDGVGLDNYTSRSEAVMAVTVAAVVAGWDEATWRTALTGGCEEIARWADTQIRKSRPLPRTRSLADADRHLRTTWANAVAFVAANPPAVDYFSVQADLAEVALTAAAHPHLWGGAAGASNHAVLQVLLDIARRGGTRTPSASSRQVSEHANVSPTTVTKALTRLAKSGWVRLVNPAQGTQAPTWRLLRPKDLPAPAPEAAAVLEDLPPRAPVTAAGAHASVRAHDTFSHTSHGGLGRIAARLVDLLEATGTERLTAVQLQVLSGYHRKTVAKHLRALQLAGLVDVDHRGVRRVLEADTAAAAEHLDDVAGELGCTGVAERRRARHAAQRAAFTLWRTDFDARRGWRVERGLYDPAQRLLFVEPPPPYAVPLAA